jgi:hypothetical protein
MNNQIKTHDTDWCGLKLETPQIPSGTGQLSVVSRHQHALKCLGLVE